MNPELRNAWATLDQARVPAWRLWKNRLHWLRVEGFAFDEAFHLATGCLLMDLAPLYQKVREAQK